LLKHREFFCKFFQN